MNWIKKRWDRIQPEPKTVRSFGYILSGILLFLGALSLFRGHHQYRVEWPLSVLVLVLTLFTLQTMSVIYRGWMLAAEGISWVLMRVILGLLYYFLISPISAGMKISGKDILDQSIDKQAKSYWHKRNRKPTKESYERLF